MKYQVIGPFVISRDENGAVTSKQDDLWEEVNDSLEGASEGCGVYIFGLRASRGTVPWYVGKAEKQALRKECFTPHKLNNYNKSLISKKQVTPVLQLLVRTTASGRISKPSKSGHLDIHKLETMLIGRALSRNPELFNVSQTKMLREMIVPGLMNDSRGKPTKAVSEFKKLLGL